MLNRKMSDYIFYGTLVGITAVVILLRVLLVGSQDARIEEINRNNITLQAQIDILNETVQENKDIQTSELYELYDIVPNVYSSTSLMYKTVAILEELGIDESEDYNRTVFVNDTYNFGEGSDFGSLAQDYHIARVDVTFTTNDITLVQDLVDAIYQSEQLFIINEVNYVDTSGDYSIEVLVSFFAFYDVEMEEES